GGRAGKLASRGSDCLRCTSGRALARRGPQPSSVATGGAVPAGRQVGGGEAGARPSALHRGGDRMAVPRKATNAGGHHRGTLGSSGAAVESSDWTARGGSGLASSRSAARKPGEGARGAALPGLAST